MSQKNNHTEPDPQKVPRPSRFHRLALGALLVLAVLAGGALWAAGRWREVSSTDAWEEAPTYAVRRARLTVTVSAGGTVQGLQSDTVKSEVSGHAQILNIVPEGTTITEEDVERGRVLVQLDTSELEDEEERQRATVQEAENAYTSARESYSIQKQQNESNRAQARLEVKFARMEVAKYLGSELAEKAIEEQVDFADIGQRDDLGGEALLRKNNLEAEIDLAGKELTRARETLKWTRQLAEKGYVNRDEEDADALQVKYRENEVKQAKADLELFLRYALPKEAEQRTADYSEARRELARVQVRAASQLAQAEADLNSKKANYELQQQRLANLRTMIEKSTIRATRPGLVVYASTIHPRRYRGEPIEEGADVRQGETIISIPNMDTLAARVEVQETQIRNVKRGQPAHITVEAMPERSWSGRVVRVSPMATSEHRWLNPNVMVYETDVAFDGSSSILKPGMSATVDITVAELDDVLKVPIQAVCTHDEKRVCWVRSPRGLELRQVDTGQFSNTHVHIKSGLRGGEQVLLTPPAISPDEVELVALPEGAEEGPPPKAAKEGPLAAADSAPAAGDKDDASKPSRSKRNRASAGGNP